MEDADRCRSYAQEVNGGGSIGGSANSESIATVTAATAAASTRVKGRRTERCVGGWRGRVERPRKWDCFFFGVTGNGGLKMGRRGFGDVGEF